MFPQDLIREIHTDLGFLKALILEPLTFCSHDVYDQVVPCCLESASVIRSNLQHTGVKV